MSKINIYETLDKIIEKLSEEKCLNLTFDDLTKIKIELIKIKNVMLEKEEFNKFLIDSKNEVDQQLSDSQEYIDFGKACKKLLQKWQRDS